MGRYYNDDELVHFGILGMKWGVRRFQNKDGSLTSEEKKRYNDRYLPQQRLRDKAVYGNGGVRRINKNMNKGYNVLAARSIEANRINGRRATAKNIGSVMGTVLPAVTGYLGYKHSNKIADAITKGSYAITKNSNFEGAVYDITHSSSGQLAITSGAAFLGRVVGYSGGHAIGMLSGGYSPKKFRY